MTDFYALEPSEQAQRLQRLAAVALDRWHLGDAELELVKHRENAVFRADAPEGRFAVRVHRAGYHDDDELRSELQWITALDRAGFRTPQVIPTSDGALFADVEVEGVPEERQVDVLEWFEGEPIGAAGAGLADDADRTGTYRSIGELMARTHEHGVRWQHPAGFRRHAWDEEGLLGERPFWGPYWELELLTAEQRRRLDEVRPVALAELAGFGKRPDRYGLIHADFLPENLLRSDGTICLIDFDDAGWGWHLFDVATTLFFDLGETHFDVTLAALLEGYRTIRPLPEDHLTHLPLFFVLRGLSYLGWAHTRRETETAQVMAPFIAAGVDELVRDYLEAR